MEIEKRRKVQESELNLFARNALLSLEDRVFAPILNRIKRRWSSRVKYIGERQAPDRYKAMLKEFYNPRNVPSDPENPNRGVAVDVWFLAKYKESNPEIFNRLIDMRVDYFDKLHSVSRYLAQLHNY